MHAKLRAAVTVGWLLVIGQPLFAQDRVLPVWPVAEAPHLRLGGHATSVDDVLFGVAAAVRFDDGRIAVVSQRSTEVKYFSPDGTLLKIAAQAGNGPGELTGILHGSWIEGDSLVVLSRDPGLTWFDSAGDYARSVRINWSQAELPCRISGVNRRVAQDGSVISVHSENRNGQGCPASPEGPWRGTSLVVRGGEQIGADTLVWMPGDERNTPNYRVYGKSLALAFAQGAVYAADTGGDAILKLGVRGDTLAVLPMPFESVRVPRRARGARERRFETPEGVRVGPLYAYPDHYPRIGRILVDRSGLLWVMAFPEATAPVAAPQLMTHYGFVVPDGGATWRVLNDAGQAVAEVTTPEGLFVLEIGLDYVLGVSRDEFDVETVELYGLTRRPS